MKKKFLFFIMLTTLLKTSHAMELTLSAKNNKATRRKSLGRALSDKARSITKPKLPKRSTSHENNLGNHQAHDQRLPSISEKETLNKCIQINPQEINKIHSHGETLLLWAARNNNSSLIKKLLSHDNIKINQQNHFNKTALHYCAEHNNKKSIKRLLHLPQTDASIFNDEHKTARDLIEGDSDQDIELRRIIFARIMLDLTVNNVCNDLQDKYTYACHITTIDNDEDQKKIIAKALKRVKNALLKDQDNQKEDDRDLPDSAKLPDYADDNFITQMILLRINKGSI